MNAKTLRILLVLAVVALGGAMWATFANHPASDDSAQANEALLPALRDHVNDVAAITLAGGGDKAQVSLKRDAATWRVGERGGYPADIAKIREFVLKLADASVIEAKTANPKRYAELGVEDTTAADAKGVRMTVDGVQPAPKLIIGLFNGNGGGGTFVRRVGEAQSLLVKGNLLAEKNPAAWLKKDLVSIESDRIKQVAITGFDGKTLRVYKDTTSDPNYRIADVPKGREPASDYAANSLGSGLSNLRIDDVAAAQDLAPPAQVFKVRYLAFGGLVVDVLAWDADGRNAVQLVASNDAVQLDSDIAAQQAKAKAAYDTAVATAKLKVADAKGDEAAMAKAEADIAKPPALVDAARDAAQLRDAAQKVVADLNAAFHGWTFVVPAYEFANFNKAQEALLKPLPGKNDAKPAVGKPAAGGQSLLPGAPPLNLPGQ